MTAHNLGGFLTAAVQDMSGEEQLFNNVTKQDLDSVTFGDNSRARAVGIGSVGFVGTMQVEQVLLVDGLKHNLLSISQLCDEGNIVTFEYDKCIIRSPESKQPGSSHIATRICTFSS